MNSIRIEDFDLASTLESGQIFRYIRRPQGYLVHRKNRVFTIDQRGSVLHFDGVDSDFIIRYFGLDQNYPAIMGSLVHDKIVRSAVERYWGLRILRQNPWECLISFLCSPTKSIGHIRVILERLCRAFGEPASLHSYQGYTFPREGRFDNLEILKATGLGFRARYIYEVSRTIRPGYFDGLVGMTFEEARVSLMRLPGVGEKIADCVLLFSFGFSQAFPIDTWIKRGMERTYFRGEKASYTRIAEFAQKQFGHFAGYAQQYLYHCWREEGRSN